MVPGGIELTRKGDYTELSDRLRQYDRERSATPLSESLARGDGKDVAGGVGRLPQQGSPSSGGPVGRPVGSVSEGESGNGLPESAGSGEEVKDGPIADLADNARRNGFPHASSYRRHHAGDRQHRVLQRQPVYLHGSPAAAKREPENFSIQPKGARRPRRCCRVTATQPKTHWPPKWACV